MPARMGLSVKARVLVLGGDSTLERDVVAALPSENCEVILAPDCRQALEITRAGQFDVLVLEFDIHFREFLRIASEFRPAEKRCRTLVVASSLEQLALATETQVDGILMKPIDLNQVRTVIHHLLDGVRTPALTESWRPNATPFSETQLSRRDWGINE